MPSGDESAQDQASRLFARYLARREAGEEIEADVFCSEHPACATELRELMAELGELEEGAAVLAPVGRTPHLGSGSSIRAGVRVGELRILRRIGRGAQGQVFEAHQVTLDRHVAVKVLTLDWTTRERQIERFRREAVAAGQLDHEHVVRVYGLQEWSDHLLIVQELVDGGSLEDRLAHEELDPRQAAEVCRQIAEGLHHVHEHDILHRDVKPANILLTRGGGAKLGDFGLAHMTSDGKSLTMTGDLVGTPWYMSPEQVAGGRGGIDARTDIYSLGAVLYRLLVGQVPFTGDGEKGLFLDILTREPKRPRQTQPAIDSDLEAVCLKAMRKAPDDRYANAGEFAHDLQRWLHGESTDARPMGPGTRVGQVMRRSSPAVLMLSLIGWVTMAWASDTFLLLPRAQVDPELHVMRNGGAIVFALVFGYLLALLCRRFSRGRRWGTAAAWVLAVVLGATLVWGVEVQEEGQRRAIAWASLVASIDAAGERRDVGDIEVFVKGRDGHFEPSDLALVARGYIKRQRPAAASPWVQQLIDSGESGPLVDALAAVLLESRGELEACDDVLAGMWAEDRVAPPSHWLDAGHVFRETGRHADAFRAYERSLSASESIGHERNLRLALTCLDLCRWEDASNYLQQFRRYRGQDVRALWPAVRLALATGASEDELEALLKEVDASGLPVHEKTRVRAVILRRANNYSAVRELERQAMEDAPDDLRLLRYCAFEALGDGNVYYRSGAARYAAARAESEDAKNALKLLAVAKSRLELARDLYSRLNSKVAGGSAEALVGLSNVAMRLAPLMGDRRGELLQNAVDHASGATKIDPDLWEGHYNLASALFSKAAYQGRVDGVDLGYEQVSLDVKLACMTSSRLALECNGFVPSTLNIAAWWGTLVSKETGARESVDNTLRWARTAVRMADPSRVGSDCPLGTQSLANAEDTLREALELADDLPRALAAAEAALLHCESGSAVRPQFADHVARLQAAVTGR